MSHRTDTPPAAPTDADTRAAVRAVGRVFALAGEQVRGHAPPDDLADALTEARDLPELAARPDRDRFRPALAAFAGRHPAFAPALAEFDRATRPAGRVRRPPDPHAELWTDCGEGD